MLKVPFAPSRGAQDQSVPNAPFWLLVEPGNSHRQTSSSRRTIAVQLLCVAVCDGRHFERDMGFWQGFPTIWPCADRPSSVANHADANSVSNSTCGGGTNTPGTVGLNPKR